MHPVLADGSNPPMGDDRSSHQLCNRPGLDIPPMLTEPDVEA
jgi:hypothetical protein